MSSAILTYEMVHLCANVVLNLVDQKISIGTCLRNTSLESRGFSLSIRASGHTTELGTTSGHTTAGASLEAEEDQANTWLHMRRPLASGRFTIPV